jgi:hypothetical protein
VTIAPAGTVVQVVLVTPIDLNGSSTTVIARAAEQKGHDAPVPEGSRFIGTVSGGDDGQLSVRFTKLLLPDGREARVTAEAQDHSGAFGLNGRVDRTADSEPSVASGVAKDTATDVAIGALGGGVAGEAARNYARRSWSADGLGSSRPRAHVTLGSGTSFAIFLHEPAIIRN